MNSESRKFGKSRVGSGPPPKKDEGFSVWIEEGTWYAAPTVDPLKFGPHAYLMPGAYNRGVRECPCGAQVSGYASSGPVDPFGPCPLNVKEPDLLTGPGPPDPFLRPYKVEKGENLYSVTGPGHHREDREFADFATEAIALQFAQVQAAVLNRAYNEGYRQGKASEHAD